MRLRLFRACGYCLSLFPRSMQIFLGNFLGNLLYLLFSRVRKTIELNLKLAGFSAHLGVPRQCFRHFGLCVLEVLQLFSKDSCRSSLVYKNEQLLIDAHHAGKGAILVSAHFGNWEMVGTLSRHLQIPIFGLYREQRHCQDLILSARECTGMTPMDVRKGLKGAIAALKAGNVLGIVGDQVRDMQKEFFGRPTYFPDGAFRLAVQLHCPLVFATCTRQGHKLVVSCDQVLWPQSGAVKEEEISRLQGEYIKYLEDQIRDFPEQYLWMRDFWDAYRQSLTNQV